MKYLPDLRTARLSLLLTLPVMSAICLAAADPVPLGRTPAPLVAVPGATANPMVGTWEIERKMEDKGASWVETTVLQFLADGTYSTSVRHSLFPDQAKQQLVTGHYAVSGQSGKGFQLALRPAANDPDAGKAATPVQVPVELLSSDSLRGPDGSVLKRIK
jgi:hypothetical protein